MSRSRIIRRSLAVVGLVVLGGVGLVWWLYGSSAALDAAERAAERRDWSQAQHRLGWYLALHPDSGPARLKLAQTFAAQSRLDDALVQLRRIPDHDSAGLDARIREAELLLTSDRAAQSERACRAALNLDPRSTDAYHTLVLLCYWENREVEGEALIWKRYNQVKGPERCATLDQLFWFQNGNDPIEESEARLRRFIATDPSDLDAKIALAKLFRRQKNSDAAQTLLESLELPPGHLEGRAVLLNCYLDTNDASQAHALLEAWPMADRQDVRYRRALGMYQQSYRAEWEQAARNFRRVLSETPDDLEVRHRLGACLQMLGRRAAAERELQAADRLRRYMTPDRWKQLMVRLDVPGAYDAPTRATIARTYEEIGRVREARCWYEQAIEIDPHNADTRAGLRRLDSAGSTEQGTAARSP